MLTPLQQRIAELFFATDESVGFALAGGAALIVRGEIDRETHDLDFFADLNQVQDITSVVGATTDACARSGPHHHPAPVVIDLRSPRDHRS